MKKFSIVLILVLTAVVSSYAEPRAIGGRLGYSIGASYQHSLNANFLEVDLDLPGFNSTQLKVLHNWILASPKWTSNGEWNWYIGVGGALGFNFRYYNYAYSYVGVAAMGGLEYTFDFPLQLSVDICPIIGPKFGSNGTAFYNDWSTILATTLSVRYRF